MEPPKLPEGWVYKTNKLSLRGPEGDRSRRITLENADLYEEGLTEEEQMARMREIYLGSVLNFPWRMISESDWWVLHYSEIATETTCTACGTPLDPMCYRLTRMKESPEDYIASDRELSRGICSTKCWIKYMGDNFPSELADLKHEWRQEEKAALKGGLSPPTFEDFAQEASQEGDPPEGMACEF